MHILGAFDKFALLDAVVEQVVDYRAKWPYHRAFIVVPENRKVMVEQALLNAQAKKQQLVLTEVLSLPRLAKRLLSMLGNYQKTLGSDNLTALLLYNHLNSSDKEHLYAALSQFYKRPEYVNKLLQTQKTLRRADFNLPQLEKELAKVQEQNPYVTPNLGNLRHKLAALADLQQAYSHSLAEHNLADSLTLVNDLRNLLSSYLNYRLTAEADAHNLTNDGNLNAASPLSADATVATFAALNDAQACVVDSQERYQVLSFLNNSYIWFYGYGEDTLITQQEWQLILLLEQICRRVELTLKLPAALDYVQLQTEGLNYYLDFSEQLSHNTQWIFKAGLAALAELFQYKDSLRYLQFKAAAVNENFAYFLHNLITQEAIKPLNNSGVTAGGNGQEAAAGTQSEAGGNDKDNDKAALAQLEEHVQLYQAKSLKEAVEACILDIKASCLAPDSDISWQDCAIALADYANDSPLLLHLLEKYELPVFIAESESNVGSALTAYFKVLLRILQNGLDKNSVIAYLRSPCLALPLQDVDEYENYLLALNLNYEQLLDERSYYKLADLAYAQAQKLALHYAQTYLLPLKTLRSSLAACKDRQSRLLTLLRFLQTADLEEQVANLSSKLLAAPALRERLAGLRLRKHWQQFHRNFRELLSYSAQLPQETLSDFLNFLQLSMLNFAMEQLPNNGRQVQVGSLETIAKSRHKLLYIINLTEANLLGAQAELDSVLSRQDIKLLEESLCQQGAGAAPELKLSARFFPFKQELCDKTKIYSRFYDLLLLPTCKVKLYHCLDQASLDEMPLFFKQLRKYLALKDVKVPQALANASDLLYLANSHVTQVCKGAQGAAYMEHLQAADFWQRAYLLTTFYRLQQPKQAAKEPQKQRDKQAINEQQAQQFADSLAAALHKDLTYQAYLIALLSSAGQAAPSAAELTAACDNLSREFAIAPILFRPQANKLLLLTDKTLLSRLLPPNLTFSLTQLELYRANNFAYFARYLLGVKERLIAGSDLRNYGIILHSFAEIAMRVFLDYMHKAAGGKQALPDGSEGSLLLLEELFTNFAAAEWQKLVSWQKYLPLYKQDKNYAAMLTAAYRQLLLTFTPQQAVVNELAALSNIQQQDSALNAAKDKFIQQLLAVAQESNKKLFNVRDWQYQKVIYPQLLKVAKQNLTAVLLGLNAQQLKNTAPEAADNLPALTYLPLALEQQLHLEQNNYRLQGKIDRIDYEKSEAKIALIDYKSGNKKFDYARLQAGLDLQLALYSQFFCEQGEEIKPAAYLKLTDTLQASKQMLVKYINELNATVAANKPAAASEFAVNTAGEPVLAVQPEQLDTLTAEQAGKSVAALLATKAVTEEAYKTSNNLLTFNLANSQEAADNDNYWRKLSSYALALSNLSVQDILTGKFPYQPVVDTDLQKVFLPYQGIAKYDLQQANYRFLKRESASAEDEKELSVAKQDKLDLQAALDKWKI